MEPIMQVTGLCKDYPKFHLTDISFAVRPGTIMGLIGRNGAGKTTTIKSVLNLIHPAAGTVRCFGMDMKQDEQAIKQRIGYAGGAVDYYKKKKLRTLLEVTARFYDRWDWDVCRRYMELFNLDMEKTPSELSEGMKVKLSLTMALSHGAELLILDEPTSGLDPVSRDELLTVFRHLAGKGTAILFSTHITSDLDKCADDITYIRGGRLEYTGAMADYLAQCQADGTGSNLEEIMIAHEREALREKLAD